MTIHFKEGRYFLGFWFVVHRPTVSHVLAEPTVQSQDYLATAWRDPGETAFTIQYRFRYYNDEKNWGSTDEKSWYEFEYDKSEDEVEAIMETIVAELSAKGMTGPVTRLITKSADIHAVTEAFTKQSYVHVRKGDMKTSGGA